MAAAAAEGTAEVAPEAEPMEGVIIESTAVVRPTVTWGRLSNGEELKEEFMALDLKWLVIFKYTNLNLTATLECLSFKENPSIIYFAHLKAMMCWTISTDDVQCYHKAKKKGRFFLDSTMHAIDLEFYGNPQVQPETRVNLQYHLYVTKLEYFDLTKRAGPLDSQLLVWTGNQMMNKIYVNSAMLSMHSPFFATFFNNTSFTEGEQKRFELRDVDFAGFKVVLHDLYGLPINFRDPDQHTSMAEAIRLADRFQLSMTMYRLEQLLIALPNADRLPWIYIADQFDMKALVRKICRGLTSDQAARLNEQRNIVRIYSRETVQLILNQITKNKGRPNRAAKDTSSDTDDNENNGNENAEQEDVRTRYRPRRRARAPPPPMYVARYDPQFNPADPNYVVVDQRAVQGNPLEEARVRRAQQYHNAFFGVGYYDEPPPNQERGYQ